jgi:hypothetical protein
MLASFLEYRTQMRVERSGSWSGTSGAKRNVAEDGISACSGFPTRGLQILEVEK